MNEIEILQKITRRVSLIDIVFIIWYGNRSGKDIDLLIVKKNGTDVNPYIMRQDWDILEINQENFEKRLRLFDPVVTEPVLTGSLLIGNREDFNEIVKKLVSLCPSKEIVTFLYQRASEELENTETFLQLYENEKDRQKLFFALIDLFFACSYYFFADYYQLNSRFRGPIVLSFLLITDGKSLLKEVFNLYKKAKVDEEVDINLVRSYMKKIKKLIKR